MKNYKNKAENILSKFSAIKCADICFRDNTVKPKSSLILLVINYSTAWCRHLELCPGTEPARM